MDHIPHIPVLKDEVLDIFKNARSGILIDCTLGFGGHSEAILKAYPHIKIIGIDKDKEAREFAKARLAIFKDRFSCESGGFGDIFGRLLDKYQGEICGVLADIGVSSYQLDTPRRGFGFESDVLDMRMDTSSNLNAEKILKSYSQHELAKIFFDFGELREAKKLASLIIELREHNPSILDSASSFSHFLKTNFKNPKILPLVYQALRIEVNGELRELDCLLESAKGLKKAILCIISFHSLEDRAIKNSFKDYARSCICPENIMRCECGNNHELGRIMTKKPLIATNDELKYNSRAKCAKLRAFEFY